MAHIAPKPDRFIRTDEVFRLTGYKRTSIDRFIKAGTFPRPSREGGALLFSEQEVADWIEARKSSRRSAE